MASELRPRDRHYISYWSIGKKFNLVVLPISKEIVCVSGKPKSAMDMIINILMRNREDTTPLLAKEDIIGEKNGVELILIELDLIENTKEYYDKYILTELCNKFNRKNSKYIKFLNDTFGKNYVKYYVYHFKIKK